MRRTEARIAALQSKALQFYQQKKLSPRKLPEIGAAPAGTYGAYYDFYAHRVCFSEKLLQHATDSTLEAILAHELGHARQRMRLLAQRFIPLTFFAFAAVSLVLSAITWLSGLMPLMQTLFTISAIGMVAGLVMVPVTLHLEERYAMELEVAADAFACQCLGGPALLTQAMLEFTQLENGGHITADVRHRIQVLAVSPAL